MLTEHEKKEIEKDLKEIEKCAKDNDEHGMLLAIASIDKMRSHFYNALSREMSKDSF